MSSRRRIYFIEAGEGGPIKIGVAIDVAARLKDLQAANPTALRLIASIPGDYCQERELHRRFKGERLNGEWFIGNGAVRAFALSLSGTSPDEHAAALDPEPPKPKKRRQREPRRFYTREEWHALFFVGDGESIYRSAEAESVFAERCSRAGPAPPS